MADDLDRAEAQMSEILQRSIAYTASTKPLTRATGICLNCAEPVGDGIRWCDATCRDDYEMRVRK